MTAGPAGPAVCCRSGAGSRRAGPDADGCRRPGRMARTGSIARGRSRLHVVGGTAARLRGTGGRGSWRHDAVLQPGARPLFAWHEDPERAETRPHRHRGTGRDCRGHGARTPRPGLARRDDGADWDPDFSHLPPSARLQFDSGATITVDMQNRPCHLPGPVIARETGGNAKAFRRAAHGRRGVTAWVERVGVVRIGDGVRLHVPDQRVWRAS